jgi:hypothetical protein
MALTHRDSVSGRFCFEKVPTDKVDLDIRYRTNAVVAFVCAELHISPLPEVIWIRPAPADLVAKLFGTLVQGCLEERHPRYTRVRPDIQEGYTPEHLTQIWIRSYLSACPNLEFVTAHETRHIWQKVKDIKIFSDEGTAEGDAYPYAYDVLKRYLAGKGRLTVEVESDIDNKRKSTRSKFLQCWPNGRFEVIEG